MYIKFYLKGNTNDPSQNPRCDPLAFKPNVKMMQKCYYPDSAIPCWGNMPEMLAAEEILREIIEKYNKKPIGWHMASDLRGNAIVIGPDIGYRIKTMMISPSENIGFGTRFEPGNLGASIGSGYHFGFRPVPPELFEKISKENFVTEGVQRIIGKILESDPVPLERIDSEAGGILGGPFLQHPDLRGISKAQQELDEKLRIEVEKEFIRRCPMRASIYR
ncbi:MAG: hypothetical protein Metus_1183 [Candidatus Methanosuratincola subterraneus]|uniref:Uncharacterized protein n=2 Tax=Candidatus Methanosuratincola (ex Vanwonterghem et al. 2016) TaxID=1915412 RepID=A0A444L6K5_METS7|nr:MAG: hypothetical protein Metus_1183 [Candidatus Methanosuratincola subterraneus]